MQKSFNNLSVQKLYILNIKLHRLTSSSEIRQIAHISSKSFAKNLQLQNMFKSFLQILHASWSLWNSFAWFWRMIFYTMYSCLKFCTDQQYSAHIYINLYISRISLLCWLNYDKAWYYVIRTVQLCAWFYESRQILNSTSLLILIFHISFLYQVIQLLYWHVQQVCTSLHQFSTVFLFQNHHWESLQSCTDLYVRVLLWKNLFSCKQF